MVSVVVPVATNEDCLDDLLTELEKLPDDFEIILVSSAISNRPQNKKWTWVESPSNKRASALNEGARHATHDWIWFVHADSRYLATNVGRLLTMQQQHPNSLLYFDLHFYDGSFMHQISAWGARMRSIVFKAPFGDQSFCVQKKLHEYIGGYREDAEYGEDHLYARKVNRLKFPLVRIPSAIGTSARNHLKHGWLNIICKYQYMWIKQAWQDK